MGAGWRRFSEQARQKWGIGDREFQVTPNTRNELMLKEATEFSVHLKRCEKDIRALKVATEGLLVTSKVVLTSSLPRVFEETGGGKVVPVPTGPVGSSGVAAIGGGDFSPEELARISKETGSKIETEVLAPMERWMNAFSLVQNRMSKLEALRLEVDSRRRTVAKLGKKVDVQRAQLPQTRARGEYDMENTIKVLQHKEAKLSACRQSYKEHEALVYHQLTNLIRDTVWLKSYISAVLRVESEAFQVANVALGSMKAALPSSASPSEADPIQMNGMNAMHDSLSDDGIPAARSDVMSRHNHQKSIENGLKGSPARKAKDSMYTIDASSEQRGGVAGGIPAQREPYAAYGASEEYTRPPVSAW
ncbi:hypothetical protein M9435_002364 [Picochlorum sp. BPE23]|nr:hypothetical protein M9435_002364 [Picochlorum sp. BPE23]